MQTRTVTRRSGNITRAAFFARSERVRVEVLQVLHGVKFPTASALLHLWHRDPYPIIDFRALWTLGLEPPKQYSFGKSPAGDLIGGNALIG